MRIESIAHNSRVLTVTCSGIFGMGSGGNPSGKLIKNSIDNWMLSHPSIRIEQIVVDYSNVDYVNGDGPVSFMLPFIKRGVTKVCFVPNSFNRGPLKALVETCRTPWFEVADPDS